MSVDLSIMFFSASADSAGREKYRTVLDAARFADDHGFANVWVPERHFGVLGGLYPNPSVLHAGLATTTRRIGLRAGSVVLPLHHPIRLVEEWSMVDNLSGGRVGLSFASGWNPNDFAFFPARYSDRQEQLFRRLPEVLDLWRGVPAAIETGLGQAAEVTIFPAPLQAELPFWITAARSPETFERAGEIGANVLTHLLDQDVEGIVDKIALYRAARARCGHDPEAGIVTVMVHTFVTADANEAKERARKPYCDFLKSSAGLLKGLAQSRGTEVDFEALSPADQDNFVNFLYERFAGSRALIGSPETCFDLISRLHAVGVDEVACLLDFGPLHDDVMEGLVHLDRLRERCVRELPARKRPNDETLLEVQANLKRTPRHSPKIEVEGHGKGLESIRARLTEEITGVEFYRQLAERGLDVEPALRRVERLVRTDGEALIEIVSTAAPSVGLDPALIDACLLGALVLLPELKEGRERANQAETMRLPSGFRALTTHGPLGERVFAHATLAGLGRSQSVDIRLLDAAGNLGAVISGVQFAVSSPPEVVLPVVDEDLGSWFYELRWEEAAAATAPAAATPAEPLAEPKPASAWLVLADDERLGTLLVRRFEAQGDRAQWIRRRDLNFDSESGSDVVTPENISALVEAAREIDGFPLAGVVHAWGLESGIESGIGATLDRARLEDDQTWGAGVALLLMQALVRVSSQTSAARLFILTRGAVAAADREGEAMEGEPEPTINVVQSTLWGLGRTCAMEHPEIWGGLVDLDPAAHESAALDESFEAAAIHEILVGLQNGEAENQLAFRRGRRFVARLVATAPPAHQSLSVRADGTYLVTGGSWGIGLEVACWLAERGAGALVLIGRTPMPPREQWDQLEGPVAARVAGLLRLEALATTATTTATVRYAAVDVADEEGMRALVDELASEGLPPIRGVVHAASVWRGRDGSSLIRTLPQLDLAALRQVFEPKVLGSWVLHRIFSGEQAEPLDFFLLFSSAAAMTGSAGQGNYAAASGFLDAFAQARVRAGLPALAVDWGPISGAGFGATEEGLKVHTYWESNGLGRLDPSQLLASLDRLLGERMASVAMGASGASATGVNPTVGVMNIDWQKLAEFFPGLRKAPWASRLVLAEGPRERSQFLLDLNAAPLEQQRDLLRDHVRYEVGRVLGGSGLPDPRRKLFDLGLDSLMALELKNRLQSSLEAEVQVTAVFNYPTIESLSAHLADDVLGLAPVEVIEAAGVGVLQVPAASAVERVKDLSDDEVDRLFAQKFAQGGVSS